MSFSIEHAPLLVFAYGNPSRGDDALGPAMFTLLERCKRETDRFDNVDLLTDYQLQIEHAIDLDQRECVLFVDASVSLSSPYDFYRLQPEQDDSYTTHAMSPAAVLAVYRKINQQQPPSSFMLTIQGYEFDLGHAITERAHTNLMKGFEFVVRLIETDVEKWSEMKLS